MTTVQRNLIAAIIACAFILVGVFVWFLQVKGEVENPLPPDQRVADPLGSGDGPQLQNRSASEPEVDMDKLFEEEKKKQPGLGSLHK